MGDKNINIVAFVAYDGTVASNQKEILNAEQYPLKYWYPTNVNEVAENDLQVNVYPNPATLTSVVKTSFILKDDAVVTMQVLNSLGQVVSKPYNSFEIKGAHTIQWSPIENRNLAPGMYFMQISTDKGASKITKLLIQ
ncbi:MAG: T9SS type A sorting domain-containing protein [Bacteroidetes bacterium]|nr:T9SS type A sorting domain-containing protein [Bacteroidota bacterium]